MTLRSWIATADVVAVDPNGGPLVSFLDLLQKSHTKIHFFGLGFIQVKMNDDSRYHFYHPELESFVENPHNHRYYFTSTVIRGSLRNHIWGFTTHQEIQGDVPAVLRYESCDPTKPPPDTKCPVRVKKISSFDIHAGSSYYMDSDTYHQVERVGDAPCVTHLVRGPKVDDWAGVICLEGKEDLCPFSRNLSEDDLWRIVSECIL